MERKIIVLLKLNKTNLTVEALEGVNGSFHKIYLKSKIEFKQLVSETKQAINDIEEIVKGKIQSVICVFENSEDFYTKTKEITQTLNTNEFSDLDLTQLLNQFTTSQSDYRTSIRIIKGIYNNFENKNFDFNDFKMLKNQEIKTVNVVARVSYVKKQSFEMMQSLVDSINLKIEKNISLSEVQNVFIAKKTKDIKQKITLNIKQNNVELAFLNNENLLSYHYLNFGFNNLVKTVAKKFNLTNEFSSLVLSNFDLNQNGESLIAFRKKITNNNIKEIIQNFFKNINEEITLFLNQNGIYNNLNIAKIVFKNNFFNQQTENIFLNTITKATSKNINLVYTNQICKTNNTLDFSNQAIIDFLCFNSYEKDITDTFIINTSSIESVKIKKSIWYKFRKTILVGVKNGR